MSSVYDPFDPDTVEDPYPAYARLREAAAVHYLEPYDMWMVPRYDDIIEILRNPTVFSSAEAWTRIFTQLLGHDWTQGEGGGGNILAMDPPAHSRLRRTVNRAFTPRMLQNWEQEIREITAETFDDLIASSQDDTVDIVKDYFGLIPFTVIAMILGIERERRRDFIRWAEDALSGLSMFADPERVGQAHAALNDQVSKVVERRLSNPTDDLISVLAARGSDGEDPLTFGEMVGFTTQLLLGGTETTGSSLSNWMAAMLAYPDVQAQLHVDAAKIAASVNETFRFDPVTQFVWRTPKEDVEIGGIRVPKGATLGIMLGSANRDERKWGDDAGVFKLDRDTHGSMVFGQGPHVCLGAHLARQEKNIAIEELISRVTSIKSAGAPTRSPNYMLRGLTSLPVKLELRV